MIFVGRVWHIFQKYLQSKVMTVQICWNFFLPLQPWSDVRDLAGGILDTYCYGNPARTNVVAIAPNYKQTKALLCNNRRQGLSQDLETGCLKLAIVKSLGVNSS